MGGGKGGSYPKELGQLLGMQYQTARAFQPQTTAWAQMGQQYMGLPKSESIDLGGGKGQVPIPGGKQTPQQPVALENMPALRDIMYNPGGANELMLRRQGETARNQIMSQLPEGGAMQDLLSKQIREENQNLAAMRVGAREQAARLVLGGGPMISPFSTLGSTAAQTGAAQAQLYSAEQQAKGQGLGGLGQMIGMVGSAAMPTKIK